MTATRLWTPIPAPPPRPPALSLVTSALQPDDTTNGRWTGGYTYAPENRFAGSLRDVCDEVTVDAPALTAPLAPTVAANATGGTLTAGSKSYKITYVNSNGETTPSPAAAATVVLDGTATVSWAAPGLEGVTVNVYGRVASSWGLIATGQTGTSFTDTGAATVGAAPPSTNTTGGSGNYGNQGIVQFAPYEIFVEDECSAFGFEARDFVGRATRLLENATPQAVEAEFWSGTLAQAAGLPNNYLTNSADPNFQDLTPGGGAVDITRGIQILEDGLAAAGFGGQGMIHAMPQCVPNFLNARRVGNQLLSVMDNIIVPGVGYPGTAPVGDSAPGATKAYIYATDLVSVFLDDIRVIPDNFEEALDRGIGGRPNTITFRAERFAAASFDAFVHLGCEVLLTT